MPTETEETTTADENLAITEADVEALDEKAATEETADADEDVELTPEQKVEADKKARADARIKEAEEAEKRLDEQRQKRRKEREEQEREERIAARERQLDDGLRRIQALEQELAQRKERAMKGGLEGLKAMGLDYSELSREVLTANTPEALAQQALQRAEALEKQLADERRRAEHAAEQQQIEASKERFVSFADANADDFPAAAELSPRRLKAMADEEAITYRRQHGHLPSFAALLDRVDKRAKEEQEEGKQRSAKRARPENTQPSDGATSPRDTTGNGHHASKPAPRTLDGAAAVTKASAKRPMSDDEVDEWALQELREAMRADKKPSASR